MEAHVRIDEGVKRGPRKRTSVALRRDPETNRVEGIPEGLDAEAILEQYLSEKTTSHIAKELGVRRKTLVAWLRATNPKRWKEVQVIRALVRKEDADEDLEERCRDALSLARTREKLRSAQFDLERLDSATWGAKQEVTHTTNPVLHIVVSGQQQVTESALHNARSTPSDLPLRQPPVTIEQHPALPAPQDEGGYVSQP